ncbi:CRISPR-associated endoribonuclease Cas6 [Dehalobacterium formicoaceticum]|uniref:CRISPR-associated endoribonuclease n=1 Tax=Dehalobacterium formicoaceticum TaxID=51515 RepID=A0ABT1Y1H6_9FIRM|nr:CRISPR-associated endoribonuclease Cas6 [Dehalobacterium formicoaceticum]MCR6544724.1 CRISPR-associated endoribonuclease Cas6 [Dehalobacterium formicoaceticum]
MNLEIYFKPLREPVVLPIHYNQLIQAALYNSIDQELASFLHNKGYRDGTRTFKMFCFSLIQGAYQMDRIKKTIAFEGEIKLTVSSPLQDFCQSLVNVLLSKGVMRIGARELAIDRINVRQYEVQQNKVMVRTLSPVVLYSTLLRADGKKYTVYFQPGETDYTRLFNENLRKKYRALYAAEGPEGEVEIKPVGIQRMKIVSFKNTVIKGYAGKLLLMGANELLQLAVDGGIGSKNSQGFGCVEAADV